MSHPLQHRDALPAPAPARARGWVWLLLALVLASILLRLVIAWYSIGTNDADTWRRFALRISERGLIDAYLSLPSLNHPPPAAVWSAAALRISEATGAKFSLAMKLPAILADAGSAVLIAMIWIRRNRRTTAQLGPSLFAWSPVAILVSAYHCNTDSVYAFLCLLACFFTDRRKLFAAGLALAAAANVKLIPLLVAPALLSLCQSRREVARFIMGLSIGVVPFIPLLVMIPEPFARAVLAYNSQANRWGIPFLLYELYQHPPTRLFALDAMRIYFENGRWVILAAVFMLSFFSWRRRAWDPYQLAAMSLAIFLVLAPGFGLQYTVAIVPLLFVVGLPFACAYSVLAGLFLLLVYWSNWTGTTPWFSFFDGPFPMPGPTFGALAWGVLIVFLMQSLIRPRSFSGTAGASGAA